LLERNPAKWKSARRKMTRHVSDTLKAMIPKQPAPGLTAGGNRFPAFAKPAAAGEGRSDRIMAAQKVNPVSASEANALFAGLDRLSVMLLAVSGGPDSTALMVLAARWRGRLQRGPKLIAVTVDHGLRKEAKHEAADVARLARKLGLTHRTLRWLGPKPKTGLQEAARMARYRLLAAAARAAGAAHVLTAHTLDDQAETLLIRMSRGSGLRGLSAMQRETLLPTAQRTPSRASGGGEEENVARAAHQILLVRPLLDVAKARLIATLRAAKIPFAEDPSNSDPRFTRARYRGLMPALAREGLDARRLALLAGRMRRAELAIEAATERAEAELAVNPPVPGAYGFAAKDFAQLPAEIALRLLGRALARTGEEGPVQLAKLEALQTALRNAQKSGTTRFRRTLAGALVTLAGDQIAVERAPPRRRKALTTGERGKVKRAKTR
jgi:tRNA(Ile)-lysidine synthase